jgi:hypothetical protein
MHARRGGARENDERQRNDPGDYHRIVIETEIQIASTAFAIDRVRCSSRHVEEHDACHHCPADRRAGARFGA